MFFYINILYVRIENLKIELIKKNEEEEQKKLLDDVIC